jgi:hypothetical protein
LDPDQQIAWLDAAEAQNLSVQALRKAIHQNSDDDFPQGFVKYLGRVERRFQKAEPADRLKIIEVLEVTLERLREKI